MNVLRMTCEGHLFTAAVGRQDAAQRCGHLDLLAKLRDSRSRMNNQDGKHGKGAEKKQQDRPQDGSLPTIPIQKKKGWEEIDQGWGDEPEAAPGDNFKDTIVGDHDDSRTDTIPGFHDVPEADTLKGTGRKDTIPEGAGPAAQALLLPDEQNTQIEPAAPPAARTEAKTVMGLGPRDVPEQAAPPPPAPSTPAPGRAPELGEADTMPISALSTEQARLPAPPVRQAPAPPPPAQQATTTAGAPPRQAPAPAPALPVQQAPAPPPQQATAPPAVAPPAPPMPQQPPPQPAPMAQSHPPGPSNIPLAIVWVLALASVGVALALWLSR